MEEIVNYAVTHGEAIRQATAAADAESIIGTPQAVRGRLVKAKDPVEVVLADVVDERNPYVPDRPMRRRVDGSERVEVMPHLGLVEATETAVAPRAYVISATPMAVAPPPAGAAPAGAPAAPRSISVDAAAVVEVQYPGYSGWYYAPQVRVTETGGAGLVAILGVEVSIPGFGTWACSGGQDVAAGQTRELFPEIYGDYPVTFDKPGQRSSGDATIAIRYGDQAGVTRVLTVTAPITPGELPKTYTGGTSNWRCG